MKGNKLSIAIIPARGGSKGVPQKNIQPLNRIPLICHTISAAIQSQSFDQIIVTSDDDQILEIAGQYPITLIKRSAELAQDDTKSIDVVLDAFTQNNQDIQNTICTLLQPTSPLRTYINIQEAMHLFLSSDCKSVVSVCESSHHPYKSMTLDSKNNLVALVGHQHLESPRQTLPKAYYPNGAIYIAQASDIQKTNQLVISPIIPYIMTPETSLDIDSPQDFKIAEYLIL